MLVDFIPLGWCLVGAMAARGSGSLRLHVERRGREGKKHVYHGEFGGREKKERVCVVVSNLRGSV